MKLKVIYPRPRMNRLLARTMDYPLVCVVGGAGYGKTTAATEYLRSTEIPHALVTLTDGDPDVLWDKLCDAVEPHGKEIADALRVLGWPQEPWAVSRVVKLARKKCLHSFLLCVDDYQLLPDDSPLHGLVETLAFEDVPNLHLLLLSRARPNLRIASLASKELALYVDADELAFSVAETDGYLAMRGLRLTREAVERIHESSAGWVSAIYLMGEGVRAGGAIGCSGGIDALFEENLLKPLPELDREMLFRLSVFPGFPLDMAETALGMKRIRSLIAALLRENAFITRDEKEEYRFHPLLRDYLRARCPQDEAQKAVCRRAVLWYAAQRDRRYFYSVELAEKGDCVEEYLALFDRPGASRLRYYDLDAICRLAMRLPESMCLRYPFPYLQICFYLMLSGEKRYRVYAEKLLTMMRVHFTGCAGEFRDVILAELLVIARVSGYGQTDGPEEPLEEAARLFAGRQSEILNPADPFTFGLPMLLHSEFMKAGTLDAAVARCQYNPYELVSDGFGRGSEPLVKAEAALLRCQTADAKRYAEQAILEAKAKKQYFILAGAQSTLMRRALFLGDVETAEERLDDIRLLVLTAARELVDVRLTVWLLRETLTLAECFLNTATRRFSEVPSGFLDGSHQSPMAGGLGIPQVYAARAMFRTGNPTGAARMCERLEALPSVCQNARLYALLLTALCREKLDGAGSGASALAAALGEAQQDGIVLPFAENPDVLPLLTRLKRAGGLREDFLAEIRRQCEAYKAVAPAGPAAGERPLSPRELVVLRLTAQGQTRAEVAAVCHVQENTVKAQLSSAYRKLGARSKTEAIRLAKSKGLL